jgi:hypothetical protein
MPEDGDLQRCLRVVTDLDVEHGWGLMSRERQSYAEHCAMCCPDIASMSTPQLRTMLCYYHTDHQLVEALTDPSHAEHAARWSDFAEAQADGLWQIRVTVVPPPDGLLALIAGELRLVAPFGPDGTATITGIEPDVLTAPEGPNLEISVVPAEEF